MEPLAAEHKNPFASIIKEVSVGGKTYRYFSLSELKDDRIKKLPISIRVLLECCLRNCDGFNITKEDVDKILGWKHTSKEGA